MVTYESFNNERSFIEALDEYRKNGLSFWQYVYCKNYALKNFIPDLVNMIIHCKKFWF